MELLPRIGRKSLRSGVHKTDSLSMEDDSEAEDQMVNCLSPFTRRSRLKDRNKTTKQLEELEDRNMELLDGISDLDGISEKERKQIVQALLNSKKEHTFYHDQNLNVRKNNEGTIFSLEDNSCSIDGVFAGKQLADNSKFQEQLFLKMPGKEEAMICEEEEEDGTIQVNRTAKLSKRSIPEVDKISPPLERMEDSKPEKENISSLDSEKKDCSFRPWTLDRIVSEADKVEPLHRHYRIVNGKVKRNPEFPLKTLDKLEYAKAVLQMFEIYNRRLREAQTKCGNLLDWGETVKVGQHQANTIDVKRKRHAVMTIVDLEESSEILVIDTDQKHSIMFEETQDFEKNDKIAPASTRKSMCKFRTESADMFEGNRYDLVENGFLNLKTEDVFRMETNKLTDIVEIKQKHLDPDISENDVSIAVKKRDVDILDAPKIINNGRRKREIDDAEDLDTIESKLRVTRHKKYAIPAEEESSNFEIHNSEKLTWKKGIPKTRRFGKSKAKEVGKGISDGKKDTEMNFQSDIEISASDCNMSTDHQNLQAESLEIKNNANATIKKDLFEEVENLNSSEVSAKKGNLINDDTMTFQIEASNVSYENKEGNVLLVEDTQDLDLFGPYMENRIQNEGIGITVVQDSQPQNEHELYPKLQDKTKAKHHWTRQRKKQMSADTMCKLKKFTTALDEEEINQDKQKVCQSPVYKKRKLLPQNVCMLEVESVSKPGVNRLMNRPASHESNSTDTCSQGSNTMLNPVGELYSTQISVIKEKKSRNALTLNQNMSTKSCTAFLLSDSEEEDIGKQIGEGKLSRRESSQGGVSMPVNSKGRGHSQDEKSNFLKNKAADMQEFIDDDEDGTLTKAKNTGLNMMIAITSNPATETLKSNKKEKRRSNRINWEQHCNRNEDQLHERLRINTVTTNKEIEIFSNEELMTGRPELSLTNLLPQNSCPEYSNEHSCNIKPGKSKSKLVDCCEKNVSSENSNKSDSVSNIKVSSEPRHSAASMTAEFVETEEALEVDQRNPNAFESMVNIGNIKYSKCIFGTLTSAEKVQSIENKSLQNEDLIQAGISTTARGRKVCINRKVVNLDSKTPKDVLKKSTDELKRQENKESVKCPICGYSFLARQIVAHAATCMDEEQDKGQQPKHKKSGTRARAHTPELEKEASSLIEICYICDGHFYKGQRYQDHLEGCLEKAKRHQEEAEMKGFKTVSESIVEKDSATLRTKRSRVRVHVGARDKELSGGHNNAMNKHEGISSSKDESEQEDKTEQEGSSHLTPPDWIKDLSSSPIRTFIPISQQQESEYFRDQFAYRLDRVEKAMAKRKRNVSKKKRTSRKRRRTSKSGRNPNVV